MADFETTTDPLDCRVWGWGLANVATPNEVDTGHDLEHFLNVVSEKSATVYFHNLKFDGHFIMSWLFRNGFEHVSKTPLPNQFTSLISSQGMFYSLTVNWGESITEFRDSLKKLPFGVRRIAETFGLPISKGDIDYEAPRPLGYRMSDVERDYIERDVSIVATALQEVLGQGMTRLTVASDALAEYKSTVNKQLYKRMFPTL